MATKVQRNSNQLSFDELLNCHFLRLQYHIAYDVLLKQFYHLFIMIMHVMSFLRVHTSAKCNEA